MSIQRIRNVRISGIAAAVPRFSEEVTARASAFATPEEMHRFIENVGVERSRQNPEKLACSDLCQAAADKLMGELAWNRDEVDLLVFLSQSADYVLPATACILQKKMGLSQNCTAFDISLGCSGWTYGISVVGAMLQSGGFRKALLLCGDTHESHPHIKPLFGNAGTATCLEYNPGASEITIDTQTDGSGYEAIIRRAGGDRHPVTVRDLEFHEDQHGNMHRAVDTEMDGAAVFVFGITKVPRAVRDMLKRVGRTVDDVDYFLFHQANLMMNEQIRKKCKIPAEKCPYSLKDFGNNSSASIPLTIVTQVRNQFIGKQTEIVACAFGVGLSWGTMHVCLQEPCIPELVEV